MRNTNEEKERKKSKAAFRRQEEAKDLKWCALIHAVSRISF